MASLGKRLHPRLWPLYGLAIALLVVARPSPLSLVVGGGLALLGEVLRLWATGYLHKNDALTMTGPYAFLRNPLYLGTFLIASGFCMAARSETGLLLLGLFLLFFFTYYMPYKNRIEGARLERLYGDAFRRYALAVPSLVPRLHAYRPLGSEQPAEIRWRAERFADNHEVGTAGVLVLALCAMVARWALV